MTARLLMVERVTTAIQRTLGRKGVWQDDADCGRAALSALLPPTPAMIAAGFVALEMMEGNGEMQRRCGPEIVLKAMVEAALR